MYVTGQSLISCLRGENSLSSAILQKYSSLWIFTRGYYLDSDGEIDIEGDDYKAREELEILWFLGYPSVPLEQS